MRIQIYSTPAAFGLYCGFIANFLSQEARTTMPPVSRRRELPLRSAATQKNYTAGEFQPYQVVDVHPKG